MLRVLTRRRLPLHLLHAVTAFSLLIAPPVFPQDAAVSDTVEVRVVNLEVVVTDDSGSPVRGLERDDFRLTVDGEVVDIDYFSAIEEGEVLVEEDEGGLTEDGIELPVGGEHRPLLVVVFDDRELDPGRAERAAAALAARIQEIAEATRGIMIVRQGVSLDTEQVFTTDPELLRSALQRAGSRKPTALVMRERNALIREIERAASPQFASSEGEALQIQAQAAALLRQIRSFQSVESHALQRSASQLRSLLRSLAGLPGRKEVLYLGRGLKARPAEPLFDLWWSKYSSIGPAIGIVSIQTEMGLETVSNKLLSVIDEANLHQVTFNTYSPGGLRSAGSSTEFSSMESAVALDAEGDRQGRFLITLARSTGGVSEVRLSDMAPLVSEMVDGFRFFYSLGFDLGEGAAGPGKVAVEVPGRDYRLRHLDRYRVRAVERTLEDLTLSALVTDLADNPLEVSVDLDAPERQRDGTWIVPILVKVPISALALLPDATRHVGKLRFVIQAQGEDGGLSTPVGGEIPVEIDNTELLSSLGSQAGYRLRMRVSEGEQKIAVAVRDEIGHKDSTVSMIVAAGGRE